jgi:hypothetical protein
MNRKIIMQGADCYSYNKETASALKNAGMDFIMGYLAPRKGYPKRMTLERAEVITELGLLSGNVYETKKDRAKGGAVNGAEDGKHAAENALDIKMPEYGRIYMAIDYDAQPEDYNAIEDYLIAAKEQTGRYPVGCYGSHAVIDEMVRRGACDKGWQAYAWNKLGGVSPHAAIHQCSGEKVVSGVKIDHNNAYSLMGFWNLESDYVSLLVKSVQIKIGINTPEHWEQVMRGTREGVSAYFNGLFKLICAAADVENTYAAADKILNLNSDEYWQKVLAGWRKASPANTKALFEKIDAAL